MSDSRRCSSDHIKYVNKWRDIVVSPLFYLHFCTSNANSELECAIN